MDNKNIYSIEGNFGRINIYDNKYQKVEKISESSKVKKDKPKNEEKSFKKVLDKNLKKQK